MKGKDGYLSNWLVKTRSKLVIQYINGDVLDLGCGTAKILLLSEKLNSYYGIEYDQSLVTQLSNKYKNAKFFQKNLDEDYLNLDIKFDCILLIAVIEHVFNQKHLFKEILKHLKPNGRIIITTPTVFGNDIIHRIGCFFRIFSREDNNDHIIIFNKTRLEILANEFHLKIVKYQKFELFCNQLIILTQ